MNFEIIESEKNIPAEVLEEKVKHFREVFGEHWNDVYRVSSQLDSGELMLVMKNNSETIGSCLIRKSTYDLRFRGFSILPPFRGRGYSLSLMEKLEEETRMHHSQLLESGSKPGNIGIMYLSSQIYPDSRYRDNSAGQFAGFLESRGFCLYNYDSNHLNPEEQEATKAYNRIDPLLEKSLKVFRKAVINNGIELTDKIKSELQLMNNRQWQVVMDGLNGKLAHYEKSGRVSYRYDLCPVCADVGSTQENSDNCGRCYIYTACHEPFQSEFKEDNEVSAAYFTAFRGFMLKNKFGGN